MPSSQAGSLQGQGEKLGCQGNTCIGDPFGKVKVASQPTRERTEKSNHGGDLAYALMSGGVGIKLVPLMTIMPPMYQGARWGYGTGMYILVYTNDLGTLKCLQLSRRGADTLQALHKHLLNE